MSGANFKNHPGLNKLREYFATKSRICYFLILTSLLAAYAIYYLRMAIKDMIYGYTPTLANFAIGLLIPGLLLLVIYCLLIYKFGSWPADLFPPLTVLLVGVFVACLLPLPPAYYERLFTSHRADFEEMVNLARNGQLANSRRCQGSTAFEPPAEYSRLIPGCIYVYEDPGYYFAVIFEWGQAQERIVYYSGKIAMRDAMMTTMQFAILKQWGDSWYLIINIL